MNQFFLYGIRASSVLNFLQHICCVSILFSATHLLRFHPFFYNTSVASLSFKKTTLDFFLFPLNTMVETNTPLCSSDDSVNSASSLPNLDGSPLFLHNLDQPGLLLVSKRLNGDNYNSWHRAMKISLSAKNKTGFITGEIKEHHKASKPKKTCSLAALQ